jgi:phosphoribosyl-AMP cyclohydrolase
MVSEYREELLEGRARRIARTETIAAESEGRRDSWSSRKIPETWLKSKGSGSLLQRDRIRIDPAKYVLNLTESRLL